MDIVGFLAGLVDSFGSGVVDVAAGGLAWLVGLAADLLLVISAALPDGGIFELPTIGAMWETGLGWLNWFVPVGQIAALLAAWLVATIAYYAFTLKLRYLVFGGSGK